MSLLGLDIGTTGCKAIAFAEDGQLLARSYREYPLSYPGPGLCELDVDVVWRAIVTVIKEVSQSVDSTDPVVALSVSALGDSVTPVDETGTALTHSVVGSPDRRAIPQAAWIEQTVGKEAVFQRTGVPIHAMSALPKMMWFRQNRPEVYRRTWKFVGWQELVQLRLGLAPASDYSQACRSMAVDIHSREYADDLLTTCGVDAEKLPRLVDATTVVGTLDGHHATMVGLRPGAKVVAGGFDQACAALGRGVVEPDTASLSLGTIELVTAISDKLQLGQSLLAGNHGCGFHVLPERYISLAYIITAGAILRWFRDTIATAEVRVARERGLDPYDLIIDSTPDRPANVYVLPYFAGTGTPWLDARQKGSIFGLELETDRAEIAKGILDGLCYELRLNLESLRESGFTVSSLQAMGGGSKSARWMQLKADITKTEIETSSIHEAGCLGAAILAGLGAGVCKRPADILSQYAPNALYQPRPEIGHRYEQPFATYCELRQRVQGLAL